MQERSIDIHQKHPRLIKAYVFPSYEDIILFRYLEVFPKARDGVLFRHLSPTHRLQTLSAMHGVCR